MLLNNIICTTLCLAVAASGDRWSRQITNTGQHSDGGADWIPVSQQVDRSNNARVLSYQPDQYNKNEYSVPSIDPELQRRFPAGQPFQAQGFKQQSKPQSKAFHHNRESRPPQQPPTSESFFKFEMPFYQNDGSRREVIPTVQADYQIQHTLPQQSFLTSPLFSQKPVFPSEYHPNYQPSYQPFNQQRPIHQNFVQDIQQQMKEKHIQQKPQAASSSFGAQNIFEPPKPTTFDAQPSYDVRQQIPASTGQQEVQLLYVPYDTLYPQRAEQLTYDNNRFNLIPQPVNPAQINNFYTPEPLINQDPNLFTTSTTSTVPPSTPMPITTARTFLNPQFTSQKPKTRPKPHQPPLAMFMQKSPEKPSTAIDVVNALSSAKSIAVLDAPSKLAPEVFVGPSGLPSPSGYTKFELPYLSSINRNNIEYLREIPFFVAPQSYRAPIDFNKILLPEPHVGSIVINKPLQSAYEGAIMQDHQQPTQTQQPQEHVRDMYNVAFTEEPVKYQSSTPTIRTTIRPSKNRFQFGTAYEASLTPHQSLRGQYKQGTRSGSATASVQTQTKDVSNQNEYFQQQFIQEIQPPTTVRSQVNYAEKQPGLNEYYKGQYGQIPQQVSPMKTIVGTKEQLSVDNFKEQFRQDVTSYRPSVDQQFNQQFTPSTSDVPPKLNPQIGEYLNEQYNQEVHPVTSIRPTTSRGRPEQIEYLKEQYIQERHPVTSLRPTTVREQTERNEYFKERYNQKLHREKPALIHSQQSQNDYYSQRGEISLTSTNPTRTKDTPKQHKFKIQNNQEELADISNTSGYAKDQLEQIQYIGGTYRQEYRPSTTSKAPSTRSKNSDRVRNNQHRRPIEISTQSSYGQFKPMPNNVVNEEYFKVQPIKTTDSTTTTESAIQQYSTKGVDQPTYINGLSTTSTVEINPSHDQNQHRYNVQPSLYMNRDEEEYRMKTYFRQQNAFKNRPTVQSTTTPASEIYENVQYTPISLDYGSQLYNLPSSTATYLDESTLREPKLKDKITFYAPTQQSEEQQPVLQETPISNQPVEYSHETEHQSPQTEAITESSSQEPTTSSDIHHTSTEKRRPSFKYSIPNNHRPTYNNEVAYSHEDKDEKSSQEQELEYEPNPYQLPSELPPLTPNLPGLVNALIEEDKENAIEKGTTEMDRITTTTSTLRPTRRPINRGKRPPVTRISSSISYSSGSETTTRRPSSRGRRPYNPRNNYNQTTHTTTARSPIIRNPNRVRYNPTPEERRQYRPRTRLHSKKVNGEEDNLDYQRDVLNQNYPVFKPASRSGTDTTTTEQTPTEAQEVIVTITPNNSKQQFVGLLEPLKIAQEYHQIPRQDNFGPGYFPNEEDEAVPTEIILEKNEINENHPSFITTTTTTTTIAPIETTKKSLFIRRGSRPSRTTTENPPTTTFVNDERQTEKSTEKSIEKFTVRPRVRPERPERPKVFKIRGRIRKPHPASTTTTFAPEKKLPESGYHELHKFNQDFYQDEYRDEIVQSSPNRLHNYNLETQESQWSPSLSNVNAFKPVNPEERSNLLRKSEKFENEPDIVTASPDFVEEKKDSFSFNVSAGIGPSSYSSLVKSDSKTDNKNTSQTSFSELLEEVMSGVENMYKNKNADTQLDNTRKTNTQQGRRKGAWKRVRVSPSDTLETSESQNIGTQIYNSIFGTTSVGQEYGTKIQMEEKSSNKEPTPLDNLVESITDEPISSSPATLETKTSEFETDLSFTAPSLIQVGATVTTNPAKSKSKSSSIELEDSFTTLPQNIDKGPDDVTDIPEYLRDNVETITDSITRRSDIEEADDLETQPSLFDEVKKQLSNLFAVEENNEDDDGVKQIFQPRKQEYTSIQRIRAVSENTENKLKDTEQKSESVTVSPFHKNLMDTVVYATSTSTEVSHETEICYRGRCVKAAKQL